MSLPFTITNSGASTFSWSVINTSSWLNISATHGTNAAGASTNVTVSLNTTVATNLAQGVYAATIIFSNQASGVTVSRNFTLNTAIINWPVALTGFNAAILASNNATSGAPGATAFDTANNYCLYQQGLGGSTRGLPWSGIFPSQSDNSTAFQLGTYGTADALMLGSGYSTSGTLTLSSPDAFNSLTILASSANGGGQGTFVLNFTNGTTSPTLAFNAQDWFNTVTNVAIQGFGRLKLGASFAAEDDGGSNPNLYQATINLAAMGLARPIASIIFTKPASSGNTAIFAVSGMSTSVPLQPPTGLTAIPGTNATVQLSWNASVGATNYNIKRSTSSGTETTVASTNATSYLDTGLVNGRTYYYVVSAVGVANESTNSSEASATAVSLVYAVYLDTFNQTNNTPLVGSQPDIGQPWTATVGGAGLEIENDALSTTGGARVLFAGFSNNIALAANEMITLSWTNINPSGSDFFTGYAGINFYIGGAGGTQEIFIGHPSGTSTWGMDGISIGVPRRALGPGAVQQPVSLPSLTYIIRVLGA